MIQWPLAVIVYFCCVIIVFVYTVAYVTKILIPMIVMVPKMVQYVQPVQYHQGSAIEIAV